MSSAKNHLDIGEAKEVIWQRLWNKTASGEVLGGSVVILLQNLITQFSSLPVSFSENWPSSAENYESACQSFHFLWQSTECTVRKA
jgi:hypothetical protein